MNSEKRNSRTNGPAKLPKKSSQRQPVIFQSVRRRPGETRRQWAERAADETLRGLQRRAALLEEQEKDTPWPA